MLRTIQAIADVATSEGKIRFVGENNFLPSFAILERAIKTASASTAGVRAAIFQLVFSSGIAHTALSVTL
jgi:hypothetical protein